MNHKKLLKIILSLSSDYNHLVNIKDIYQSLPEEMDLSEIYCLIYNLYDNGFIKLESTGYDSRAELTSRGALYLLS